MTQPTFSDGPPVPMMVEGAMDATKLRELFSDLAASAVVSEIREKGPPTAYANPAPMTLVEAQDRLLTGVARAVQVCYRYDGHHWIDTILAQPPGFRVVRCRREF